MKLINYIHKVQGLDKIFPVILELKSLNPKTEVMTVLDLEERTRADTAAFFSDLCTDLSDHIVIANSSSFCRDIVAKASSDTKLFSEYNSFWLSNLAQNAWHLIKSKGRSGSSLLQWAAGANYMLGIYNGFKRPLAQQLKSQIRKNGGQVIGYFKSLNDRGHGLSALCTPSIRKIINQSLTEDVDLIMLPDDNFRTFFPADIRAKLVATGYPPFYFRWKEYVKTKVDRRNKSLLDIVIFTRGETSHKNVDNEIIGDATVQGLLRDIYYALQDQKQSFRLRIKPHPYQNAVALEKFIQNWPEGEITFDPPMLLAATADILIGVYSSAILDGLVFGVPLIDYFEGNDVFERLHSRASPFQPFGVAIARTPHEFGAALRNAIGQKEAGRSHPKVEEANLLASQRLPEIFS